MGAPFASLANFTSALLPKLPPGLQTYLDDSVDSVAAALANASSYIQSTTGIPPTALYSSVAGALLMGAAARSVAARKKRKTSAPNDARAQPAGVAKLSRNKKRKAAKKGKKAGAAADSDDPSDMRRYGWSTGQNLSPFTSTISQDGIPDVTDDGYDYINSDDLYRHDRAAQSAAPFDYGVTGSRSGGSYFRPPNDDLNDIPQEDVLLLRHGNEVREEFFPAYSIGDGKLYPEDVRDRVQLLYDLSDAQTRHVKLYYKGRLLKNDTQPVSHDGVKNNSELLVVLPGEEAEPKHHRPHHTKKGSKSDSGGGGGGGGRPDRSPKQPVFSSSTGNLEVPGRGRADHKTGSSSRAHSANSGISGMSGVSGASGASLVSNLSTIAPPQNVQGSAMDKLNNIAHHFETKLLPLCDAFIEHTPTDKKKRDDDHRKISETIMQHVLLKLDEVDTGGDDANRARRKSLVNRVQDVLKEMDTKKAGAS